jgi:hypothetical protein
MFDKGEYEPMCYSNIDHAKQRLIVENVYRHLPTMKYLILTHNFSGTIYFPNASLKSQYHYI